MKRHIFIELHLLREVEVPRALDDALENFLLIIMLKRCVANKKLVDEATECPVVGGLIVALRKYKFRAEVLWCTTKGKRLGLRPPILGEWNVLCEAEVDHLEVSILIHEQIFGLQITISHTQAMNILECTDYAATVKLCILYVETSRLCAR